MLTIRLTIVLFAFIFFAFLPQYVFAETTSYRSAGWVETDKYIGASEEAKYFNLNQCQTSDGLYCSRSNGSGSANLYLSSFGTLADFGIPQNATITKVHIRIKGKNNTIQRIYLDRGRNKNPLSQLCQNPFDLWQVYLGPTDVTITFHTLFTPFSTGGNNLSQCFTTDTIDSQNYTFSIYDVESHPWSADIDNFEIAFDYTPPPATPTPTPSPTVSSTPTPTAIPTPVPFLDLPWKYDGDFEDSALAINSYFDHEYPFLSSGLSESSSISATIVNYLGFPRLNDRSYPYSRHDGYDYGLHAKVDYDDPVLAAASGLATYHYSSAGGNMIFIDHRNSYQTRYLHMQKEGLVTMSTTVPQEVQAREIIGKVGTEGNCRPKDYPSDRRCAHIHFSVIEDKNHDGNFEDNIPDGLTDPYGWQSEKSDPWEQYSFFYNGKQRTGNKSYYLWTKKIPELKAGLPSNGGVFHLGDATVTFPDDQTRSDLNLEMQSSPYDNISNSLVGVVPSINITAKNLLGDLVKFFTGYITIKIDFSGIDLSRYDLGTTTFSIYSSDDKGNWTKEPTVIDLTNKIATTQVNHLTYFSLMAERIDTVAPVTTGTLQGDQGQVNWFRSNISVSLNAQDNIGGLGVDYTLYRRDDEDWQTYTGPFVFFTEGHHKIEYYSVDKDGNIESVKTVEFAIDRTSPEAEIRYNLATFDTQIIGKDSSSSATTTVTNATSLHPKFIVNDLAGNTLIVNTDKIRIGKQVAFSIKNLQYKNNPILPIDTNIFFTFAFTDKNNVVKQIDQYYSLKDDKRIFTNYLSSSNTTKIYTRSPGSANYIQENKSGIVLLKLFTQNGTLKYSY